MRFVARAYKDRNEVIIVREDGKVKTVSYLHWTAYLNKCLNGNFAHLCRRSLIVGYGNLWVGIVKDREIMPEDLEELKGMVDYFNIPEFAFDEAVALMYSRDSLFDLSCAGCEGGREVLRVSEATA